MISKRAAMWQSFSDCMLEHIDETERGHYGGAKIQPIDFFESYAPEEGMVWWLVFNVCKYLLRLPNTQNPRDIYKAAHYLSRLWAIWGTPNDPREDCKPET